MRGVTLLVAAGILCVPPSPPAALGQTQRGALASANGRSSDTALLAPMELATVTGGACPSPPGYFVVAVLADATQAVALGGGAWARASVTLTGAAVTASWCPGSESAVLLLRQADEIAVVEVHAARGAGGGRPSPTLVAREVGRVPLPGPPGSLPPVIATHWTSGGTVGLAGLANGTALRIDHPNAERWEVGCVRLATETATPEWAIASYAPRPVPSGEGLNCYFALLRGDDRREFFRRRLPSQSGGAIGPIERVSATPWRYILPSPDGRLTAVVGDDQPSFVCRRSQLKDVLSGVTDPLLRLSGRSRLLRWSPSGTRLAACPVAAGGYVYDFLHGSPVRRRAIPRHWDASLAPWIGDDTICFARRAKREALVWPVESARRTRAISW